MTEVDSLAIVFFVILIFLSLFAHYAYRSLVSSLKMMNIKFDGLSARVTDIERKRPDLSFQAAEPTPAPPFDEKLIDEEIEKQYFDTPDLYQHSAIVSENITYCNAMRRIRLILTSDTDDAIERALECIDQTQRQLDVLRSEDDVPF